MHSGARIYVGNYSELLSKHISSSLKCMPAISRKDLVSTSMLNMFCMLCIGGEFALSFCREVPEVSSMASIGVEPRKSGKENIHYIYNTIVGLFMP